MAHINEKLDFCVEVFIVHKNKVLLRMHDKYKIWLSVGGHIDPGEDPIEAAIREVKEEVGLDIKIIGETHGLAGGTEENRGYKYLIPPRYMGRHPVNDVHEHVALVYFALSDSNILSESMNAHEQTETKWVSRKELDTIHLIPNVKFYTEEALKELSED